MPFYNDPKMRSIAYQVALCAVVALLAWGAISNAIDNLRRANIASGFGFWHQTAGFDISQSLIEFSSQHLDLRPGLLGRPSQYAAGRRARHRLCDHPRLHRRHLPAVEELAAVAGRHRLCRTDPQRPAAAAIAVLVQRRAQGAAGDARQHRVLGRQLPQQSRPVFAAAGREAGFRRGRDRACRRHCRRDRLSALGEEAADGRPASSRRSVGWRLA